MFDHRRIAVIVVVVASAFGAGLGLAQARPADDWCRDECAEGCSGHEGCGSAQAFGCDCIYVCNDLHEGSAYCTF